MNEQLWMALWGAVGATCCLVVGWCMGVAQRSLDERADRALQHRIDTSVDQFDEDLETIPFDQTARVSRRDHGRRAR